MKNILRVLVFFSLTSGAYSATLRDTFYWVQPTRKHPLHQKTIAAFHSTCQELGMKCASIGTEEADVLGTITLLSQALDQNDAAGVAIWVGGPEWQPIIDRMAKAKIPVVLAHAVTSGQRVDGITALIGGIDPSQVTPQIPIAICKALEGKKGSFAITQGAFNAYESTVATNFAKQMTECCPEVRVLNPEEETFDPERASEIAVNIIEKTPDLLGAFSTTASGAQTWTSAQRKTGRKLVLAGGNQFVGALDFVRSGELLAFMWSPSVDEAHLSATVLHHIAKGETYEYWNEVKRPVVTSDNVDQFSPSRIVKEPIPGIAKIAPKKRW